MVQLEGVHHLGAGVGSQLGEEQDSRQEVGQGSQQGAGLDSLPGVELQEEVAGRKVGDTVSVCVCVCVCYWMNTVTQLQCFPPAGLATRFDFGFKGWSLKL